MIGDDRRSRREDRIDFYFPDHIGDHPRSSGTITMYENIVYENYDHIDDPPRSWGLLRHNENVFCYVLKPKHSI